jgi:hypothetical protein
VGPCRQAEARTFAHALVRLAISYIPTAPPPGHDAPAELGRVFSPYVATVPAEPGLR